MYQKFVAEYIGTFTLTLIVALSLSGVFPVSTPILAALTLGFFVYTVGAVSGAHLNPAVTLGLLSIKKISSTDALSYVMVQCFGAISALIVTMLLGIDYEMVAENTFHVVLAETAGMILFSFGIASYVLGQVPKALSGFIIGTSLFLGVALASLMGSNGILNPAVAIGIKSFNLMYILGPILGSVLGMKLYTVMRLPSTQSRKK